MIDVNRILTQVLAGETRTPGAEASDGGGRQVRASNPAGGLGDLLGQAQQAMQTGGLGGLLTRGQDMLRQQGGLGGLLGGGRSGGASGGGVGDYLSGQLGGMGMGAAAGVLASVLLGSKGGRKLAGSALKMGALAVIGGLAYKAYQNYQSGQSPAQSAGPVAALPEPASLVSETDTQKNEHALLLLRAMIAAATSDGDLDDSERERIVGQLHQIGLSDEEARFIDAEVANPKTVNDLAAGATTTDRKAEVYLASLLAIEADTTAEKVHLAQLAAALSLEPALVQHLNAAAESAKASS